jgi:hypoxanthine phosphoribosyltransferase
MSLVFITPKTGHTMQKVFNYLLSKDIDITTVNVITMKAKVPKKYFEQLEKMATVITQEHYEQTLPNAQQVHSG